MAHLESRMEYIRRKFQMFFNGFERVPPTAELETLKREMRDFQNMGFATAQARFKAQNLVARFTTQRQMWERDLVRKEEGLPRLGAPVGMAQAGNQPPGPNRPKSTDPIDDL